MPSIINKNKFLSGSYFFSMVNDVKVYELSCDLTVKHFYDITLNFIFLKAYFQK